MKPKALGLKGENLAAQYLVSKGYEILESNFTVRGGEIDLVAKLGSLLVFVEVKTRTKESFGHGEESINALKRHRIKHAIDSFLMKQDCDECDYRVDIIEVNLDDASQNFKNITHFEDIEL